MGRAQNLRILDANFNRSREGLRVCEDIARFIWEDRLLSTKLKRSRHAISGILKLAPDLQKQLLQARESQKDIGRKFTALESIRRDISDVYFANLERVKESLRVLEEILKLFSPAGSKKIKTIRFEVYAIEKKSVSRLEVVRHHRPRRA